jgi:hypothetical protein
VVGSLLLLIATVLLVGGGAVLWADRAERTDGYLSTNEETLTGPGYALVSERIELSTGADWIPISAALGTVRFTATGTDPESGTFIGIAPVDDATAYLGGVEHTVVDDLGIDSPGLRDLPGGEPSGPPGDQDFWTAQTSGTGTQELTWAPAEGNWMLVVMNADGSPGLSVESRIGATAPALDDIGWGVLISGVVCLLVGALVVALVVRRPADRRPGPPGARPGPAPSGAPSSWAPQTAVDWPPAAPPAPRPAPPSESPTRSESGG